MLEDCSALWSKAMVDCRCPGLCPRSKALKVKMQRRWTKTGGEHGNCPLLGCSSMRETGLTELKWVPTRLWIGRSYGLQLLHC